MMRSMESLKPTVIVSLVAVWHGAVLSASAAGVIGVDGSPLSGSFDPTKCRIDRSDDQFKSNEIGGQCARCVTNDQCRHAYGGFGWYCCPFMKRCVNSGSMGCYDTAFCKPRCFGEKYPELKKECSGCDSSFPDNWVKGCTRADWPALVQGRGGPAPAPQPQPRPVPQPVSTPNAGGGGNNNGGAGGEPDWCEYCQPDIYGTKRCEYWKEQLNWCVSGKPVTMREKCAETCGYCDGCSGPVAALPTPAPVPFNKVGEFCQPDNKQSCASWKKKGYCDGEHKEWMKTVCADTCGYCTPSGQPASIPAPAPRPAPQPRWESPTPRPVAVPAANNRNANLSGCARHGEDGAACQAAAGCEWSWDQFACISSASANDKCGAIGADGQTCVATAGCEWDWNTGSCVTEQAELDKCQRIGADGFTCNQTEGCRWDWDVNSCVLDASARIFPAGNKRKGGKKGRGGGCAGLNSKKCSKSSSCVLVGRVCRDKF